jgi:hypothetical protein
MCEAGEGIVTQIAGHKRPTAVNHNIGYSLILGQVRIIRRKEPAGMRLLSFDRESLRNTSRIKLFMYLSTARKHDAVPEIP